MRIPEAFTLADKLHRGRSDKAGRPYIGHLRRVQQHVATAGGDADQQVAALLHDSIEDGLVSSEELKSAGVSCRAIELVEALTRRKGQPYQAYLIQVREQPAAVLVKLADIADNLDPGRLMMLPPATAAGLARRYEKARAFLEDHATHGASRDAVHEKIRKKGVVDI